METAEGGGRPSRSGQDGSTLHEPHLEVSQWFPPATGAGVVLTLTAQVQCPFGCDLQGASVSVMGPEGAIVTSELVSHDQGINRTGEVTLLAPSEVGEHDWSARFRPSDDQSAEHAGCSLPLPFRTEAHPISLAVWDVPTPVVVSDSFSIKIGAKCLQGCDFKGVSVGVYDESDERLSGTELGEGHWPGSDGLYWADVELSAPPGEGVVSWSVRLSTTDLELPHQSASSSFSFATARVPEHQLTLEVVEASSTIPVSGAEVSLGVYRASTDDSGRATVAVADGTYRLTVWKVGYEAPPSTLVVSKDLTVRVEAAVLPDTSSWEDD